MRNRLLATCTFRRPKPFRTTEWICRTRWRQPSKPLAIAWCVSKGASVAASIGGVWTADGTVFNSNPALEWEEDMRVAVGDCRLLEATVVGREAGTENALLRVAAKQYPSRRYPSRKDRV